jgi:hypothetical protein
MKEEVLWCGTFFCSTIKSCLFAYLQFSGSSQHPGMLLKPKWTRAGEREQHCEQVNDKHSFCLLNIHLTHSSRVSFNCYAKSLSSLWEARISLCPSLIILRMRKTSFPGSNKHARDQCGVSQKPSLERWVTESKFCPIIVSGVITHQVK